MVRLDTTSPGRAKPLSPTAQLRLALDFGAAAEDLEEARAAVGTIPPPPPLLWVPRKHRPH